MKPCFQCSNCKRGTYELCANYDYLGSRCDGGFAEYVAVPIWNLLEIPDTVNFETAAMMEPASVAMHALRQSNFKKGDTVAVIGPGTIGMILCRLLLLFGAKKVWLIGRSQVKLDFAQNMESKILLIRHCQMLLNGSKNKRKAMGLILCLKVLGLLLLSIWAWI